MQETCSLHIDTCPQSPQVCHTGWAELEDAAMQISVPFGRRDPSGDHCFLTLLLGPAACLEDHFTYQGMLPQSYACEQTL